MRIGVPAEIKNREYRVGLVPQAARELVRAGHEVSLEGGAGSIGERQVNLPWMQLVCSIVISARTSQGFLAQIVEECGE